MSEGLTQDDFRKLMATPRRPAGEEQQNTFKAPLPKAPRNVGAAVFAQPRSMRKKNAFQKKKKPASDDDEEEQEEKSNYRDRAAERRQQEVTEETAESMLQAPEADQELDPKQVYEQSKFLGGDVDHTHLVKGLDFALLKKVRTDLMKKQQEEKVEEEQQDEAMDDHDLDQMLDKFERGEKISEEEKTEQPKVQCHSLMAKNIFELMEHEPPRNEMFEPGRMVYVFELADEVGHYSDAFAIPTAMMRSKTDVAAKLARLGWSEEAESNLVIERISRVMASARRGERQQPVVQKTPITAAVTSQPIAMVEDGFMGDIFADAGRDYELDESTTTTETAAPENKGSYFTGLVEEEEEEDVEMQENDKEVKALLSKATGSTEESNSKKRKYDNKEMDADAADIDMFGLSSSALPTSFAEHEAYESGEEEGLEKTQMIDQGTNRNKKAQCTRWDFDTEEEWQTYKDTIEIHPKSAFQFGVKLGDGRKRNRERKGMNDKQKLNRDYQQVKNIMSQKYGKSL